MNVFTVRSCIKAMGVTDSGAICVAGTYSRRTEQMVPPVLEKSRHNTGSGPRNPG